MPIFTMQLVSFSQANMSETEPILPKSITAIIPKESSSSSEIMTMSVDGENGIVEHNDDISDEYAKIVIEEPPQCRICLDTGGDDLIAPCCCRGTQKYVHRSCLDHWRSTKEGFAFAHCTECKALFVLRANILQVKWLMRLKFQLLVVRDHIIIFIIMQLVVAILGMLMYKLYGKELEEMFDYEGHPHGFYTMAILAVILVGLLYGLSIAIICGQRIKERHYHVLSKQELTKEYIVENRDEKKNFPELDPSHITELRKMGLY